MPRDHHRPVHFTDKEFAAIQGGDDPALVNRVAHETANALLHRVREDPDPAVVERLVTYTDVHGIDAIAELWARVGAHTLPGALWRIYLVRVVIRQNPEEIAYFFERGTERIGTIDEAVAGAEHRRRVRRRSSRSRTASCTACTRATSRWRSTAERRSAG